MHRHTKRKEQGYGGPILQTTVLRPSNADRGLLRVQLPPRVRITSQSGRLCPGDPAAEFPRFDGVPPDMVVCPLETQYMGI